MSPQSPPPVPPPPPWVLIDPTIVEQAATALARLEGWLASGDPAATADCAHACSGGEDDPVGVARWVGTLAELLRHRIEEANTWS